MTTTDTKRALDVLRSAAMRDEYERRLAYTAAGWRFCHNKSARKHRRQRHAVHYFADGEYRWRAK